MSPLNRPTIQGAPPWGRNDGAGGEDEPREAHPRQEVTYRCEQDCIRSPFTITFAAEVTPRDTWQCPGGHVGVREGAPEGTPLEVELPGHKSGGPPKDKHAAETTPKAQLLKRRTKDELEVILGEALDRVRGTGAAR